MEINMEVHWERIYIRDDKNKSYLNDYIRINFVLILKKLLKVN